MFYTNKKLFCPVYSSFLFTNYRHFSIDFKAFWLVYAWVTHCSANSSKNHLKKSNSNTNLSHSHHGSLKEVNAQIRPLIRHQKYSFSAAASPSAADDEDHCRSFVTFNKKVSAFRVNPLNESLMI